MAEDEIMKIDDEITKVENQIFVVEQEIAQLQQLAPGQSAADASERAKQLTALRQEKAALRQQMVLLTNARGFRSGAVAGPGPGSTAAGGVAYAGPSSSVGAAAVLREIVSPPRPSSVVCVSLSVFNDAPLASMLASHAQALGISGKVLHVSVKHTQYTLLFPKSSTEAEEKLRSFLKWVKERTLVLVGGVQPPGNEPCCVLLVDPESCSEEELESCEADLIGLLQTGRLAVAYASPQVQQAMEKLLRERERSERSSLHSLGRSGELSANE